MGSKKTGIPAYCIKCNGKKSNSNKGGTIFCRKVVSVQPDVKIGNLIDNALRYNRNTPIIKINLESGKDSLVISIKDNGIGISKENFTQIFEKFYRIPTGDIHENEGFGLGLYFVKNTVSQMKGNIKVSSQMGKGTTFTIEFPLPKV